MSGTSLGRAQSADLLSPDMLEGLGGLEIIARHIVTGFISGLHRSPFIGSGDDFSRHRAYQVGDEVRRIDWRLFARSERLFVKEFREASNLQAFLLVDTSGSMGYGESLTKLRYACYLAAALAHLMLRAGDAVGLAITQDAGAHVLLPPRNRRGHLHQLLLELETLRPAAAPAQLSTAVDGLGEALRRRGRVVVISDFLDADGLLDAVGRLRARGDEVLCFRVSTREELGEAALGPARYYDPDSPGGEIAAVPDADPDFRVRVAAWYESLGMELRERGAELALLTTADPIAKALRAWVESR